MSSLPLSPSLSRPSVKEWSQQTTQEKNSFFQRIIEEHKLRVSGEKPSLSRTPSQSSLCSSSSSLVEMSEADMALLAAAAQLGSVGHSFVYLCFICIPLFFALFFHFFG